MPNRTLRIPLDLIVDDRTVTADQVREIVKKVTEHAGGVISQTTLKKTMHETKPEVTRVHLHMGENCPECYALVNDGKK